MIKLCNSFLRKWRFLLLLLLVLLVVNLGHVRASEKSPPEDWQLQGMLAALDDSDPDVWVEALKKMSRYDLKSPVEIPPDRVEQIGEFLSDEDSDVREASAKALGEMGSEAKQFIPELLQLFSDNDSDVREAVATAVGNLGLQSKELIPQLLQLFSDEDSFVREAAAMTVGNLGSQSKELIPQLQQLLSDEDSFVREAAAMTVGNLGLQSKELIPQLQQLFSDKNWRVREAAATAVGSLGSEAKELIPQLLQLFSDKKWRVREAAATAVGSLGSEAKELIPQLLQLLRDEDFDVREAAAMTVGSLGSEAKELIPQLQQLLRDEDSDVREAAATAVGSLGSEAKELIPQLLQLLRDEDSDVREAAATAVGNLGSEAKELIPQLLQLLRDEDFDVREAAAMTVGNLGSQSKELIPQLLQLLRDEDSDVREAAATAVGNLGSEAKELISQLQQLLSDENWSVREAAATAVGSLGSETKQLIPQLLQLLSDEYSFVRSAAATAVIQIGKLNTQQILPILNAAHKSSYEEAVLRFIAYFVSGGEYNAVTLIQWLGSPKKYPYENNKFDNTRKEGKKVLNLFAEIWQATETLDELRPELERQIAKVVDRVQWEPQDINLLTTHYKNLKDAKSTHADSINTKIKILKGIQVFSYIWKFLLLHAITWLILLSLYPKSPEIQTLFWHPLIRRIAGLGYVGLLLTWIPFLRRRLLSPFQPLLIADANLDSFNPQDYFPDSNVCLKNTHNLQPIKTAIAKVQSPIILEGESGLGKSMFLRYWAKTCKNLVVYLPASKCSQGAIAAIQAKIPISQTDGKFLENLIYNNALEICIDGLNEVTPDTRTKISYFVERHFRGHILLATQPLDWIPPSATKTYILQPLKRQQIRQFLQTRQFTPSAETSISQSEYEEACEEYLEKTFNSNQQSEEERKAVRRLLSNPMDLTIVAQILAQGKNPDLLNLQQQQYNVMAAAYEQINFDSFPLTDFAETAYQMRLNDEINIPSEWKKELNSMENYKMVLRRQRNVEGNSGSQWYFRHDKIQEYFIVQTFLGEGNQKLEQHIKDPRFRGVYLLLATLLPYNEALLLREKLLINAAETKDHVVSDQFIQRLNSRSELSKNGENLNLVEIIKLLIVEKNNNINIEVNPNIETKPNTEFNPNIRNEKMNDSYSSKYDQRHAERNNIVDQEQNRKIDANMVGNFVGLR
ncbi:sister chromatid cohesion protein PDS5 [Okeania sp. SIO1I7]|uniref:sister chromatid cohesion protein PDS5 n=1 Tax=Okeania sp. SIO1I7 TaxID=2607772 RepID=UPI0013F871E1|nr:sister chromatid cohesion protein PDS5 [Okeania sp. SIO1I7]NET28332.1 HEAT repeat domain-containing protein [Okeania sp. SIO1I7]